MKQFAQLFLNLDRTNKTNEKIAYLKEFFVSASERDKIWALALFTGRRPSFKVNSKQMRHWAAEAAGIPAWLFNESYHNVGDLGETISLILPVVSAEKSERSLADWFQYLNLLPGMKEEEKKQHITSAWRSLTQHEIFVFNKLVMGSFRIGVSQTLMVRALAEVTQVEPSIIAHRIMGKWSPIDLSFEELILSENHHDRNSQPYPFFLAYPIEGEVSALGSEEDWMVEWKWDGIRSQILLRDGELYIWTRGEELMTDKFPELHVFSTLIPNGTVLDGEIVAYQANRPLPFNVLQTRIGRKNLTKKILEEAPIAFIAYDLLEEDGVDIRLLSQIQRRTKLTQLVQSFPGNRYLQLSPLIKFSSWEELKKIHDQSREQAAEGFMIKRKTSSYQAGRKKGDWWKWKVDPLSVDAVLIYAQKGHGRRSELFTDYTFGVWNEEHQLVPFAKAYSGLTDAEIAQVDHFIKRNTIEKFGPVRTVTPELVFEIGFEGINFSPRHKSGIAVRFPRILRWRKDKNAADADTLKSLRSILENYQ
jgi:DNA ligase-1